ncbi:hypothetical protein [Streptomyces sp. NBC_01716]|nr:hypothetical protein [Streptomyces sp. NBC_01716]
MVAVGPSALRDGAGAIEPGFPHSLLTGARGPSLTRGDMVVEPRR